MNIDLDRMVEKKKEKTLSKTEVYTPDKQYSFTLNLCDAYQHWGDPFRYRKCVRAYMGLFKKHIIPYCTIYAYPEMSRNGRFHYHGVITFKSYMTIFEFLQYGISELRSRGMVEIDTIADIEIWKAYITKDRKIMESYLVKYKQPYRLDNSILSKVVEKRENTLDAIFGIYESSSEDEHSE